MFANSMAELEVLMKHGFEVERDGLNRSIARLAWSWLAEVDLGKAWYLQIYNGNRGELLRGIINCMSKVLGISKFKTDSPLSTVLAS